MDLERLDPLLTQPKRLAIVSVLAKVESVEFSFLREYLGLSDSNLSKQMKVLVDAGYVVVDKVGRGPKGTTWYSISDEGRGAFDRQREALEELTDPAIQPVPPHDT